MITSSFKQFFLLLIATLLTHTSYTQKNALYIEPRQDNNENVNPYNYDNKIFVPGKTYLYDYFIVKGNDTLKYKITPMPDGSKSWAYVPKENADSSTVVFLGIKTLPKKGPIMMDKPDYDQTEIFLYHYNIALKPLDTELTGVIENKQNVWLHPFRFHALQILQLAPFPYAKLNLPRGQTYRWDLAIGKHWPEFRALEWKGRINMKCNYTIGENTEVEVPYGKVSCTEIRAEGVTREGTGRLLAYFNEQLGFVKLVYNNLDGSVIVISLKEVR
ncbi:MAG: hypothetical protein DI535_09180 [Citrobacter freundii]|nr:MAG: hypothetical protein DI535_09180 [Citrobacter freundii]